MYRSWGPAAAAGPHRPGPGGTCRCRWRLFLGLLLLAIFGLAASSARADYDLVASGTLVQDTTWSGDVLLTGDVTVLSTVTLSIAPGTTVHFAAQSDDTGGGAHANLSELIVLGSLAAAGTEAAPIIFKSDAVIPAAGDWGGIRAVRTRGAGGFQLSHCRIEKAVTGVLWRAESGIHQAALSDRVVSHGASQGVRLEVVGGARLTVDVSANALGASAERALYADVREIGREFPGGPRACDVRSPSRVPGHA